MEESKWFLKSRTIWGLIVTALGAVAPVMKAVGYDYPSEAEIGLLGDSGYVLLSAFGTFGGLLFAFYGRIKATVQTWVVAKPVEPVAPAQEVATVSDTTDADNA